MGAGRTRTAPIRLFLSPTDIHEESVKMSRKVLVTGLGATTPIGGDVPTTWANALKGFNIGGGTYYVGERPVNEYTQKVIIHNTTPGVKPFNLNAYTTLNLQAGYAYKNVGVRVFANNLNNALGYNAYYRGGYINRNDPRNFAVQVNYKF